MAEVRCEGGTDLHWHLAIELQQVGPEVGLVVVAFLAAELFLLVEAAAVVVAAVVVVVVAAATVVFEASEP